MLIEDVPDVHRLHPAIWREKLDAVFEPTLTPEERVEQEAAQAAADRQKLEREWDSWGASPEQIAAQEAFLAMAGEEG